MTSEPCDKQVARQQGTIVCGVPRPRPVICVLSGIDIAQAVTDCVPILRSG